MIPKSNLKVDSINHPNYHMQYLLQRSFNSFTPRISSTFPYSLPYNSYDISSENLVLNQLIIPKLIFLFILITCLFDSVLIWYGEILSQSPVGVKGLILSLKFAFFFFLSRDNFNKVTACFHFYHLKFV